MINHNHDPIRGIITPDIRKKVDEFINSELRIIESALTTFAQDIAENARDIPKEWTECEDCENRVLDSHGNAYGFLAMEFYKAIENHL